MSIRPQFTNGGDYESFALGLQDRTLGHEQNLRCKGAMRLQDIGLEGADLLCKFVSDYMILYNSIQFHHPTWSLPATMGVVASIHVKLWPDMVDQWLKLKPIVSSIDD